jgi:hypothetical protein
MERENWQKNRFFHSLPFEAIFWTAALLFLAFNDPTSTHYTLCPLALAGFDSCPGCGLGRSVSYLFRGEFAASFASHPLGFFAVAVLISRITSLIKKQLKYGQGY